MLHKGKRAIVLLIMAFGLAWFGSIAGQAQNSGTIVGAVKTASGEAAIGALVRAKQGQRGLATTVVSQDQGRYKVSNLPPGEYTVQAVGGGYQTNSTATVQVKDNGTETINLDLSVPQGLKDGMSMADYAKLMPEDVGKNIIVGECSFCHTKFGEGLITPVSARKTRDGWKETVDKMRHNPYGNNGSLVVTDEEAAQAVNYMAKYFGADRPPFTPERDLPKTWVTGDSSKFVATEFDLPAGARPHDVAVDSNGIGWAGEDGGTGMLVRCEPQPLACSRIPIPSAADGTKSGAHSIAVDPRGRIWIGDNRNGRAIQYDPPSRQFTIFTLPKPALANGKASVNTFRFPADGAVWMSGIQSNQIVKLDLATKEFTAHTIPSGVGDPYGAKPYGMAVDGENFLWFAQEERNKVGRVEPKSGEITEYRVPLQRGVMKRMDSDPAGNVWLAAFLGDLVKIDYRTGKMTSYPTPTRSSGLYSVDVDKKRNQIWASEYLGDRIARFDPRTNRFVEYPFFVHNMLIRKLSVDPSKPNRVWFSGHKASTVGYLDVLE